MEEEAGGVTLAVALVPVGTGVAEAVGVSVVAAADGAEGVALGSKERKGGKDISAPGVDLADLPPFFDIVNGFFNRCRGDMVDLLDWSMLLQIKLII